MTPPLRFIFKKKKKTKYVMKMDPVGKILTKDWHFDDDLSPSNPVLPLQQRARAGTVAFRNAYTRRT